MESSESAPRSSTPPHYPYYGVHVSDSQAVQILAQSIPEASFLGLAALPDGTYYNNRVYRLQHTQGDLGSETSILKVCGRASGREKPRNEVNVLRLIGATRPELPVPRIIAWSGQNAECEAITEHAWILMTLLEGQSLDTCSDVDETDCRSVFDDVAGFLSNLRKDCPEVVGIGNLVDTRDSNRIPVLGAPVDTPSLPGWPKTTYLEYITSLLAEGIAVRKTDSDYAEERDLVIPTRCRQLIPLTDSSPPRALATSIISFHR